MREDSERVTGTNEALKTTVSSRAVAMPRPRRTDLLWVLLIATIYLVSAAVISGKVGPGVDRMMLLAIRMSSGSLDVPSLAGQFDTATAGGRVYLAFSLLPTIPYLAFVPFEGLWPHAKDIIPTALGILTACLSLPLVRRFGVTGTRAHWLATLSALGTLLWFVSVTSNFCYLAHVESVLCCFIALIEWQGKRRPWVIGLAFAAASLARPTLILAVIPFGLALFAGAGQPFRRWLGFAIPVAAAVLIYAGYNLLRFGTALDGGYATSLLVPELEERRRQGLFSLAHVPYNIYVSLAHGFQWREEPPYITPDFTGHSMLLTTPAYLLAFNASRRDGPVVLLTAAAILVAVPVYLYYGGGIEQYGFRYGLDFAPFLLGLVAIGSVRRFELLERVLIVLSVLMVAYGVLWAAIRT